MTPPRDPGRRTTSTTAARLGTRVPREYVALAALDSVLSGLGAQRARRVTKPLLMPILARGYAEATRGSPLPVRRATLAAQLLSGAGDVALLGQGDRAFLAGLGSFLGAHVAYTVGFVSASSRDPQDRPSPRGARLAAGGFLAAAPALGRAAGRTSPRLRAPVVAYAGVLCAMVAATSRLGGPPSTRRRTTAGAALFLLSDGLLGAREFLLDGSDAATGRRLLDVGVMVTYTAAQGLIAAGVTDLVHAGQADAVNVQRSDATA